MERWTGTPEWYLCCRCHGLCRLQLSPETLSFINIKPQASGKRKGNAPDGYHRGCPGRCQTREWAGTTSRTRPLPLLSFVGSTLPAGCRGNHFRQPAPSLSGADEPRPAPLLWLLLREGDFQCRGCGFKGAPARDRRRAIDPGSAQSDAGGRAPGDCLSDI